MSIESEILALTDEEGFIKPRAIVDWAKDNPESELHAKIEWDDNKAADKYRLNQARQLITIHVRNDEGDRSTISLVQDRNPEGGYRHIGPVLQNAELRRMALRQALRELKRFEQRYRHLTELAKVWQASSEVETDLQPETDAA